MMKCRFFSANEWLYPDTEIDGGNHQVRLVAAENSYACVQVLISEPDSEIRWAWNNTQPDAPQPDVFRLREVYVNLNAAEFNFTLPLGTVADHYTRQAPFWVYDAMEPVESDSISCDKPVCALYFRWSTKEVKAGEYAGEVQIGDVRLPVQLTVYPVAVPEKESLRLTNWFSPGDIAGFHHIERWSDAFWEMLRKYALLMRHARQTDFMVHTDLAEEHWTEDGKCTFDFSRMERYVRMFLSMGFTHLELGTFINRDSWEASEFRVTLRGERLHALSEQVYDYMYGYYTGLYDMLKRNGWLSIAMVHVADEPTDDCAAEYRILSGIVRKFMPGVPIIEAVETANLDGAIDIWVPKDNQLHNDWDAYDRKRKNGDTVWFYTCCVPCGKYLNRLLDEELLRTRYLHWANRLFDLPGYLHWGLNFYSCCTHPFEATSGKVAHLGDKALPCGDTHIVYPGEDKPWGSVRLEMLRAGCEDYELLTQLQAVDSDKAAAIIKTCVRTFVDYSPEAVTFEPAYEELLQTLSGR